MFLNLVPPFPDTLLRKSAIGICSRTRTRPCCPLQLRPQAPAHTLALVWVCTPTPRGRTVSGSCLCSSYCCSMDSVLGTTPCLRFTWLVHCTPCHCSTTTTTNKPRPLDTNFNRTQTRTYANANISLAQLHPQIELAKKCLFPGTIFWCFDCYLKRNYKVLSRSITASTESL